MNAFIIGVIVGLLLIIIPSIILIRKYGLIITHKSMVIANVSKISFKDAIRIIDGVNNGKNKRK